jgi:YaiO family outer membrane protein
MISKYLKVLIFLLVGLPCEVLAFSDVEEILRRNKNLIVEQKYAESLSLLETAEESYPDDVEINFSIIRTLMWKGSYSAAEERLSALDKRHEANADVQLLRANLAYYRKDYIASEAIYKTILISHPEYEDAKMGLERTRKALADPPLTIPYRWQADVGYEHSGFSRRPQPNWKQEFLQLTHFLDNEKTAAHGKITRYDQFTNIDTEFEVGVDHVFAGYLNAYAYGAIAPEADFRPESRMAGGGAIKVLNKADGWIPIWLTLDSRYDHYDSVNITNMNPGLRIEPLAGWSLAVRKISVDADNAKRVYGEDYRLDGTITGRLRFYAGYADAPETVAAITVNTQTYFGGIAFDMTPESTLRLGYTHDDRENSFIRKVINASVSYKF